MNNIEKPIVTGIGEILWDVLPDYKRLGGAPANFASHAHSLGAQAQVVSAIGNDTSGNEILQLLNKQNIKTDYISRNSLKTGWVEVKLNINGIPEYTIHTNVAWDHITTANNTISLAQNCHAVCFGSLAQRHPQSKEAIHKFLDNTNKDCLRIFDINIRQDYYSWETITESLHKANILKINDSELEFLCKTFNLPNTTEDALMVLLEKYQLQLIALTLGSSGSIMISQNEFSHCHAIPTEIKDTIGAGDSFTAAMTMGLLNNIPIEKLNELSGKIAAFVCSQPGATPQLPQELISEFNNSIPITACDK